MFEQLCTLLLRLYPAEFRRAYGDEAVELVRDRAQHERGLFRRVRLLMDLALDLTATALRGWQFSEPLIAHMEGSPRFDVIDRHAPRPEALVVGVLASTLMFSAFPLLFQPGAFHNAPAVPQREGSGSRVQGRRFRTAPSSRHSQPMRRRAARSLPPSPRT